MTNVRSRLTTRDRPGLIASGAVCSMAAMARGESGFTTGPTGNILILLSVMRRLAHFQCENKSIETRSVYYRAFRVVNQNIQAVYARCTIETYFGVLMFELRGGYTYTIYPLRHTYVVQASDMETNTLTV